MNILKSYRFKKRISLFILCIVMMSSASCSLFKPKKEIIIKKVEISKPALNIDYPEAVKLSDVHFFVVTPENQKAIFDEMKKRNYSLVLFGLTDDDYKSMSINFLKIRNYVSEQHEIIKKYKLYYEKRSEHE